MGRIEGSAQSAAAFGLCVSYDKMRLSHRSQSLGIVIGRIHFLQKMDLTWKVKGVSDVCGRKQIFLLLQETIPHGSL